jgi:hypothetical protein
LHFPIYPDGVTHINSNLAFSKDNGRVLYFNGQSPIAGHDENDVATFRAITSQFCVLGLATQVEVANAFGVTKLSVMRAVKIYRTKGPAGFYAARLTRGPAVLTPPILARAQELLDQRVEVGEVAATLCLKPNTLAKAIRGGRLHRPAALEIPKESPVVTSAKSQRSGEDAVAPMGVGATDTLGRVAASLGQLDGPDIQLKPVLDVPHGGVLLALPALLALGLLRHTEKHFNLPKGYYRLDSIFLLLAFMALARMKSLEALRYHPPGEWGKLLGLDRVPEVRTMRDKVNTLATQGKPALWSVELCKDWMEALPDEATAFYIDGHVRVYHGEQTKLPKCFVSREKLCLRASVDYWVNAMDGQPFFVAYQSVDPGLINVLENQILPRLNQVVPGQPTGKQLEEDPLLHRFTMIFDRAGYSPKLIRSLKEQRVACLTYRKAPGEDWREGEFFPQKVELVMGQVVEMRLAERGTLLGSVKNEQVWVREIRRLMPGGHQTSVICTDYKSDIGRMAAAMFARWCQENFFKYMLENYGIDRLVSYQTEDIPDGLQVVNPTHRKLDGKIRSQAAILSRKSAELGALSLVKEEEATSANVEIYLQKKSEVHAEIVLLQQEVETLKKERKATKKHIPASELQEGERFKALSVGTKQLLDTVKMVAYRAETAMAQSLQEKMARCDDSRSLLRAIYATEIDLLPDYDQGVLRVRLHGLANPSSDASIGRLCRELNETETEFPGTKLRLTYELVSTKCRPAPPSPNPFEGLLVSSQNPRDQEV